MDNNKLNLYQKIAKVKGEMAKAKLPKTGYNGYTKFNYFQLDDFEPFLEKLCSDYGLVTFFNFTLDTASMAVINSDEPEQSIEIKSPISIAGKTGNPMQDIGAMQTYARRYLFMSFFGITESDTLDAVIGKDKPQSQSDKSHENTSQPTRPSNQSKASDEDVDFMSVWKKTLAHFGYDTKKAKESESNRNALSNAKDLVSQRYGKGSITELTKEQICDLDAFLSNGPENFVSDELPA